MKKEQETRITVRFPAQLIDELKPFATTEDRSLNWEIVQAVRSYLADKRKERKHADQSV